MAKKKDKIRLGIAALIALLLATLAYMAFYPQQEQRQSEVRLQGAIDDAVTRLSK